MSVGVVNKQTGDRIPTAGMPAIDDALDLTSVNPVQNAVITAVLANKQDKTDNNLETTAKNIVGAINEHEGDIDSLKSGLTNLQNDAVTDYIEVVMSGTGDGQHYEYPFKHPFTLNRVMFMVMRGTQSGSVTLSTAMYFSNFSDAASVSSSDTNISSELVDGTLKIKVDAGASAWVTPVIIMTRHMYNRLT